MADKASRAKHAFGSSSGVQTALDNGVIDERDILFLDEDTDNPKIGWVTKDGNAVIVNNDKADLTELEAQVTTLETQMEQKVDVTTVQNMIETHYDSAYEIIEF